MDWNRKLPIFFAGVLILSILGPFGTYAMDFWSRLVFWTMVFTGVGFFMHVSISTLLGYRQLKPLPPALRIVLGAIVAGLPATAIVYFVDGVLLPPMPGTSSFPVIWLQVSVIGALVGLIEFLDWSSGPGEPEAPRLTRLHRRLPPELGHDIISVSMQDHYAEVTTILGSHMLLMRFGDILNELKGAEGVQLHRSHWASLDHIRGARRDGRKLYVILSDERTLPVSATYAANVARWLGESEHPTS